MRNTALFVSWCRPDLIRPRTVQIGRVAKGLAAIGWEIPLVCATFDNEADLFDRELRSLYGTAFSKEKQVVDLNSYSVHGRREYDLAHKNRSVPAWSSAVTAEVGRWISFRRRPLVVSFAQPWDCHTAVLAAKLRYPRIRWVAHFSDPWATNPYLAGQSEEVTRTAAQRERQVIEAADAVIFVTEMTSEMTMRQYPEEWRRKAVVIPHSTDSDLAVAVSSRPSDPRIFRLTHTGALYSGQRSGDGLYVAIHELQNEQVVGRDFQLRLVGEMPTALSATIDSLGIRQMVSVATPLYFLPSLTEMNQASALLVIDADLEPSPFLPSKIFDYLLFDRPMIALTPRGSTTEKFLSGLGYETAPPNDVSAIKQVIARMVERWRRGELKVTAEHRAARKKFDLRNVAKQYSELFHRL